MCYPFHSFVCEKMGGEVSKSDLTSFSYELHISELKTQLDSNIIPIGRIERGTYYHRALLFKVSFYEVFFFLIITVKFL